MIVEWVLIALLFAGGAYVFFAPGTTSRVRLLVTMIAVIGLLGAGSWQKHLNKKLASRAQLAAPHIGRPEEYASSVACRACHPDQYTSWHRSYHRTMTQIASAESVRGDFNNVTLELDGETYHLERRGDEFWVEMTDPDLPIQQDSAAKANASEHSAASSESGAPRVHRRITMLTGSHHMQAYWVDNQHGNQQYNFPFVYLFEQERWVPRRSAFLKDPSVLRWIQVWNVGCIDCHSTAGQPRQKDVAASLDTRVAELGIAWEACHGPAAEHVRLNTDPRRRYAMHFQKAGDPSIVNPARLSSKRSSEVCGRCHSIHSPREEKDWLQHGERFHPGEDLEAKLNVVRHMKSTELRRGSFWSDDMVRVSGREYNGLIKTPCFQKGDMSCLSCHSMHQSSPTNQLARGMDSNSACLQCHQSFAKNLEQHTHHSLNSTGSLCYNCHMPYTSYGLLKALRSHQISNPSVQESLQTGRPNACNLCHLDKTLDWTGQQLSAWYKIPQQSLLQEDKTVAASILWALKGDAGQRALIAWHMGWKPAREISGDSWLAPYLAPLLEDPYSAVRYIAGRSLKRLPGYENFRYDYVTAPDELHRARERAFETWTKTAKPSANAALLLAPDGQPEQDSFAALLSARDNRVLELHE